MARHTTDAEGPVHRLAPPPFREGLFADLPLPAPKHNGTTESVQAAASIMPVQGKMQRQLLSLLHAYGPQTCEALEHLMDGKHQSVSPRLIELEEMGMVVRHAGDTAPTRSGRSAKRWHITQAGRDAIGGQRA